MKERGKGRLSRESILAIRWIRPFAHRLAHASLWHFNRHSVPRGVALGLAVGFLVPVAQIAVAAALALSVRANLAVAAGATFVTNPLTYPAIYYAAYRFGRFLLGRDETRELSEDQVIALAEVAATQADPSSWSLVNVLLPMATGLLVFAVLSAILGFVLARVFWSFRVRRKWHRRGVERRAALKIA